MENITNICNKIDPIEDYRYQLLSFLLPKDKSSPYIKNCKQITDNIYGYQFSNTSFLPINHYSNIPYPDSELKDYLSKYAKNNTIIITFIDYGYIDQLVQFFHTSIQGLNITNFLALVDYPKTKKILEDQYKIPSVLLKHPIYDESGNSRFGSKTYIQKVNMKTLAMIQCLFYGYTVLFSDVDIAFLKNPFPYFDFDYDINIQIEAYYPHFEVNSGFVLIQPTYQSIDCLFTAWDLFQLRHLRQQVSLNQALLIHKKRGLKVNELNNYEFPNGAIFFDEERESIDDPLRCISF